MSDASLAPSDAIRILQRAIALPSVLVVPAYIAQDLANLRRAHSNDFAFATAVRAVSREISLALKSPATHGVITDFEISGWRRSRFPSHTGGPANLRLVFRPATADGVQILAFGDRRFPWSVYLTARERL